MNYGMRKVGSNFRIPAKNCPEVLKALQAYENRTAFFKPHHFDGLKEAFNNFGWDPVFDALGNLIDLDFEEEYSTDEKAWLSEIAPFVEPGSSLDMEGEDSCAWRWYFDGKTVTSYNGQYCFPDCPDTGLGLSVTEGRHE